MSVEQSWQPWRVALYLEGRKYRNSLRRSFQNPVGLLGSLIGLLVLIGIIWGYFVFGAPLLPQQQEPLPAGLSPSERLVVARFMLTLIAFVHLLVVLIGIGFQPYGFLRYFSESDLHFLVSTPAASWRLIRALLVARSFSVLGLLILSWLAFAISLAYTLYPKTIQIYLEHLRTGGWLLVGYFVLRYLQGLFFDFFRFYWAIQLRGRPWLRWVMVGFAGVWIMGLVLAIVSGLWLAIARGMERSDAVSYALNWLPTLIVSLPARATADALLAVAYGWTTAMGAAALLWIAGILWLFRYLTRHSAEIVDMIAVSMPLGAGAQGSNAEEPIPYAARKMLDDSRKRDMAEFRTPRWLERWRLQGIYALLWRDLITDLRMTPLWLTVAGISVTTIIFASVLMFVKTFSVSNQRVNDFTVVAGYTLPFLFAVITLADRRTRHGIHHHFELTRSLPFTAEQQVAYLVASTAGGVVAFFLLPACVVGLLIDSADWHLWLSGFVLLVSYTVSGALLSLVGELLTAQPYLTLLESVFKGMQGFLMFVALVVGWLTLGLSIIVPMWFPMIATLIVLVCLPFQCYLLRLAAELWQDYTPLA